MSIMHSAYAARVQGAIACASRSNRFPDVARRIASLLVLGGLLCASFPAFAQFTQQGAKLVGNDSSGSSSQGLSAALSADGNTAIVGGPNDFSQIGAAWIYTRSGGVWSQQGSKLVGSNALGGSTGEGWSVALSADGNTALFGGFRDNGSIGAVWVFTRSGGVWTQQGTKLVGTGAVNGSSGASQGMSVALSADGNTAVWGGPNDNSGAGAAWVFTRSAGVWTQQGSKLVGSGASGGASQGSAIALSGDSNTLIVGGVADNSFNGATWVFARSAGTWTQQGAKLVGTGHVGNASQGSSVAVSSDGNTFIVGGPNDSTPGAAWVFTRSAGTWSQQGAKLVGTGNVGGSQQGIGLALSADGNTAILGGNGDNSFAGAAWVFTRSAGAWTQQGSKLVGTGATGSAGQGRSVALSGDSSTAMLGGPQDSSSLGAVWPFVQPALQVTPATNIVASGFEGGPFNPTSFPYQLSTTSGSFSYSITGIPSWLNVDIPSGTATTTPTTVTFSLINVGSLTPGAYTGTISFTNTTNGTGSTTRTAALNVNASLSATPASGAPPLAVTFTTLVAQGDTNTYTVNFGDGATSGAMTIGPSGIACVTTGPCFSAKASTSHSYTSGGTYTATLLNSALTGVATATITVGAGAPPVPRSHPWQPFAGKEQASQPRGQFTR
jgi:hypothetical protein